MEVAAGGAGGQPVSTANDPEVSQGDPQPVRDRARLNVALYLALLLLACAAVVGGVMVWRTHQERDQAATEQQRYGEVLAAATEEAEAFINISYRDAQASIDKVAAGATGKFREQYTSASGGVLEVLQNEKSVMDGEVVYAGVVDADQDSATVIAATSGTVSNVQTDNKPVARNFRLQLELVREGDQWLTTDLQFVG